MRPRTPPGAVAWGCPASGVRLPCAIILVTGVSLTKVGVNWVAGGVGNPNYGAPVYLGIAAFVLCLIMAITR